MGRVKRYKRIKSFDPFYNGPRKPDHGKNDLPPSAKDFDQPMPRRFLQDMSLPDKTQKRPKNGGNDQVPHSYEQNKKTRKQLEHKRCQEDDEGKEATGDTCDHPAFKRRKGETTAEFLLRVDQETNERISAAHKKLKTTSERRKKYHQGKKLKQQLRKLGVSLSDYEGAPQLDFNDLKDHVKFGEFAQAPPKLHTAKQQKKSKSSQQHKVSKLLLTAKLKTREKEKDKEKEVVGLHRQQMLEEERERVILMYRAVKKTNRSKISQLQASS